MTNLVLTKFHLLDILPVMAANIAELDKSKIQQLEGKESSRRRLGNLFRKGSQASVGIAVGAVSIGVTEKSLRRLSLLGSALGVIGAASMAVGGEVFDRLADDSGRQGERLYDRAKRKLYSRPVRIK